MEALPSEEGDAEMAPADLEQQQVIQEGEIAQQVRSFEELCSSISQRLASAGRHRVMGDIERRCMAFMEMELSLIVASLKLYPLDDRHYFYEETRGSLDTLNRYAYTILESSDPRDQTLLPRALVCCRRRYQDLDWSNAMLDFVRMADLRRRWYMLLFPASSTGIIDVLPHQASDQQVFGIDRPMKKLLRWLLPPAKMVKRNSLSVMSVIGPVGIGKTTLAVELHNRLKRQASGGYDYFDINIIARLSREEDGTKLLLQDILSKISDPATPAPASMDEGDLVRHVKERLQDKRYFVCIDDLSEDFDWYIIKGAFPGNNLGSRVLITTSVVSKAWECCSDGLVHEMKPLNLVDSKTLLLTSALGSLDYGLQGHMKRFVNKILMRYNGLPLFINGLAEWLKERFELLQNEVKAEEKIEIYEKEQFQVLQHEQIQQALSSAYDRLPQELKVLLLYMSMLPYEHKFEKEYFIRRWFVCDSNTWTLDKSFCDLIDRNIITRVVTTCKSDPDEGEPSQWHINHFMHQFLISKSADIGFGFTSDTLHRLATDCESKTRRIPRRLALRRPDQRTPQLLQSLDLSETRYLAISGAVGGIPLEKFDNLLELDLEGWENLTDEDLLQVCTIRMIFLRYLKVSKTPVRKLPQEIKNLLNLVVLDVSYTQISELPLAVFELEYLKELDIRGTQIRQLPKEIAGLRNRLSSLLLGDGGAINSIQTTRRVAHDVRHLTWLHTLATIDLSEQPASFVEALGDLKNLRVLAITWSFHQSKDQDYREALLLSIRNWRELQCLTIHCGLGCSMEFLGSLIDPPRKLENFKVTAGRFASVPKWIRKHKHLSFVQITICQLGREDLEILGGLPFLQSLILGLDFIPTKAMVVGSDGFHDLQKFTIDCPMPWLTFSTGAMRKLTYLRLKFCAIPVSPSAVPSGLDNLRRLTEVVLCYDEPYANSPSVKMTVEAVKKQVAMHHNPVDLFINGIEDYDVQAVDEVPAEDAVATQSGTEAESEFGVQAVGKELVRAESTQIQFTWEIEEIQSEP